MPEDAIFLLNLQGSLHVLMYLALLSLLIVYCRPKESAFPEMTSNEIHNSLRTNKPTEPESSALPQQAKSRQASLLPFKRFTSAFYLKHRVEIVYIYFNNIPMF